MILKIGPFNIWSDAMSFLNLWTEKTRGKARRLERGLELFEMYRERHQLSLWGQTQDKERAVKAHAEHHLPPAVPQNNRPTKRTKKNAAQTVDASFRLLKETFEKDKLTVQELKNVHGAIEKKKLSTLPGP